jgi:hypothetical protein
MKTKKVTLTGPEIAEAIGMWVQKKTPGMVEASITGPFSLMVLLGLKEPVATVEVDVEEAQ